MLFLVLIIQSLTLEVGSFLPIGEFTTPAKVIEINASKQTPIFFSATYMSFKNQNTHVDFLQVAYGLSIRLYKRSHTKLGTGIYIANLKYGTGYESEKGINLFAGITVPLIMNKFVNLTSSLIYYNIPTGLLITIGLTWK